MSEAPPKPTRDEFVKFWENCERRDRREQLMLRPYSTYFGSMVLYTVLMACLFDLGERLGITLFVLGYVVLVIALPWIWIRRGSRWARRNMDFVWCAQCREFFREDINGDWRRPHPKWQVVAESGTCPKCGYRVLAASPEKCA